jgi:CYTH domain-containing protein
MDVPKYAKLENERRFWVAEPPDLADAPVCLIEDLYVDDSRLRLRAITRPAGGPAEFKFCKKHGSDDPMSGPIVNMYLSAEEHALLAALPGSRLRKRRYTVAHAGRNFSVDVFEGALQHAPCRR